MNFERRSGAHGSPKFLENMVILCFERRFSKQNRVIRLKSNILPPLPIFWPLPNFRVGYATGWAGVIFWIFFVKLIAFNLEFKQESEYKTYKSFGVGAYVVKAGVESESKILDSVHHCETLQFTMMLDQLLPTLSHLRTLSAAVVFPQTPIQQIVS